MSDIESIASELGNSHQGASHSTITMSRLDVIASPHSQDQSLLTTTQVPFPNNSTWEPMLQSHDVSNGGTEYPMNWLPFNDSIGLDYSSILGFNMASYNSFEGVPMSLPGQGLFPQSVQPLEAFPSGNEGLSSLPLQNFTQNPTQAVVVNTSMAASSPAETMDSSSQGSSHGTKISIRSGLYATSGDGARVACTVRADRHQHLVHGTHALPPISSAGHNLTDDPSDFGFPDLGHIIPEENEAATSCCFVKPIVHEIIIQQYQKLCHGRNSLYSPYNGQGFPTLSHMNFFVQLYFEYFDTILPFIHHEVDINASWLLVLAVCAIGCQYTSTEEFDQCVRPMHEFLRRGLSAEIESSPWQSWDLPLTQALVLSQVGLLYQGSPRFFLQARARHGTIIEIAKCSGVLVQSSLKGLAVAGQGEDAHLWGAWVDGETRRRLAFSLWVGSPPRSCSSS